MLENCAIVGIENYKNGAKLVGRKPAKLSTYKTFLSKTIEIMKSAKGTSLSANPQNVPQNTVGAEVNNVTVMQAPPVNNPVGNQVQEKVASPVLTKEAIEQKKTNMGVEFYGTLGGNITNVAEYRRLRIGGPVVDGLDNGRKLGSVTREQPTLAPEQAPEQPEIKTEMDMQTEQKPFDFSNPVNITNQFQESEEDVKSDTLKNTPPMHSNADDKLNDYLNGTLSSDNQELNDNHASTNNVIDFNEIVRKKEELDKKRAALQKLQQEKEELLNRVGTYQEQLALAARKFDEQTEMIDQASLETTMQIKDLQARVIQMSDLLKDDYEEEDSYGGKSRAA